MRKILITYLPASLLLAFLAMILVSCGGGGDGSDSGTTPTPTPPSTKSVVITGTVPGTVAMAYELATGKEADRNVASGTPKTFSLNVAPGGYYLMFIENEGTSAQKSFAFQNVTGGNVLTFKANTTLDLGVLGFNNYPRAAVPLIDRISGNDNITESLRPEASFSPGAGEWIETRKFVNSTCSGHSPGTTVTGNVTIAQGFGLVTYTPAGTTETATGVANVNTAILTASSASALETIYLTMQSDNSLAGTYSKVGYGGECSEEGTLTAVLDTSPPPPGYHVDRSIHQRPVVDEREQYRRVHGDGDLERQFNVYGCTSLECEFRYGVNKLQRRAFLSGIFNDQTATIAATYSSGGITKTATMDVTITSAPSIPFTQEELSGKVFFSKNFLYILNADKTLELYATFGTPPGDPSYYVTGTWSNDNNGLYLNFKFTDYAPAIVQRIADSPTEMVVEYFDTFWGLIPNQTWEKTMSVDPVKLPGTYTGSDGYTWVFNENGTGTVSIYGGITFTWSVDSDGVLRMPSSTGYTAVFYARATSQSTATQYTILKVGFAEHNASTGYFYKYYGGLSLTRQ